MQLRVSARKIELGVDASIQRRLSKRGFWLWTDIESQ